MSNRKKETEAEKVARKAASTPESRYQGMLNAQRTRDIYKKTAKKAALRRSKKS